MAASSLQHEPESVLLFEVPWETYEAILAALPERKFRHTYDRGTLEILNPLLSNVPWESYASILEAFGDRRFRHTYSDGALEIMSPSEEHEWLKKFVGRLIETAALELDTPIKCVGSTTQRHEELARGLEPDESYYIQHEQQVRGIRPSDAQPTPPPDLVIEVEITHRVLNRLEAYATLGVPEVWRYRDKKIVFFALKEGEYEEIMQSKAFPLLDSPDIAGFVNRVAIEDENTILRSFVQWLREKQSTLQSE